MGQKNWGGLLTVVLCDNYQVVFDDVNYRTLLLFSCEICAWVWKEPVVVDPCYIRHPSLGHRIPLRNVPLKIQQRQLRSLTVALTPHVLIEVRRHHVAVSATHLVALNSTPVRLHVVCTDACHRIRKFRLCFTIWWMNSTVNSRPYVAHSSDQMVVPGATIRWMIGSRVAASRLSTSSMYPSFSCRS